MKKGTLLFGFIIFVLILAIGCLAYMVYTQMTEINKISEDLKTIKLDTEKTQTSVDGLTKKYDQLRKEFDDKNKPAENVTNSTTNTVNTNQPVNNTVNSSQETKIAYEVIENKDTLPSDLKYDEKTKGQELIKSGNEYYAIIKAGEKSTAGHSIKVTDVKVDGLKVTIKVKEQGPNARDTVAQVITYPCAFVKLTVIPSGEPTVEVVYE
jgi:hypothetical protein